MPFAYREIGNEILNELEIDTTRLGEPLSTLNEVIKDCLKREAWSEVLTHCESAHELCDGIQGAEGLSDVIDTFYAEGIFHAYEGISHFYQADKAEGPKESAELAKAIHCLEKSRQAFRFLEYRDHWNEIILCLNLGRLYRSQNKLNEALLAFQRILCILDFNRLSIEKGQKIAKVVLEEMEKTRTLFSPRASGPTQQRRVIPFRRFPIIDKIAAGEEKPVSDYDIIGHIQQTDELEFECEGQTLKAELLKGSRLAFSPEYDYAAVQVSGDSMDEAGIAPNDYVILRRSEPSSGDIAVVVFRGEDDKATLKRFYFDKSSGSVTLKPESANPEHKTRILRPDAFAGDNPSVEVVGIAIAVLKP